VTLFSLVRHGQSVGGPGDACLAPQGFEQAQVAANALDGRSVVAVFSSPLCRARETAEAIASRLGVAVEIDERLRERANWGDAPGVSWREFVAQWERSNADPDFVVPGGVSAREAGERAAAFVRDVHARYPDDHVVAVAHGGIIVDLLLQHFDEAHLLRREPGLRSMRWCAITELRYDGERGELGCLADWPGA
jgi:broad specificity phosphatase PhoE